MQQRVQRRITHNIHVPTISPIPTIRTPSRDELLFAEARTSVPTASSSDHYFSNIYHYGLTFRRLNIYSSNDRGVDSVDSEA